MLPLIGLAIVVFGSGWILYLLWRIHTARRAAEAFLAEPFHEAWREILHERVPLYRFLPQPNRETLEQQIRRFLARKNFEACGRLEEVTEEMRLTIAGNACLLLAGRPEDEPFPSLRSVLLYPDTFVRPGEEEGEDDTLLLGESWGSGSVVLSWDTLTEDSRAGLDGFNVILHEFAHQLDQEFGIADGLPLLEGRTQYRDWAEAFTQAYERHRSGTERGRRTVIDPYGAQDPAEFFSCATETFFELPEQLAREWPRVYDQLRGYYRIDPKGWDW